MDDWTAVAVYSAVAIVVGVSIIGLSRVLGPRRPKPQKLDPYECGMPLLSDARERFRVHFYLVAIIFILFDIETVFMIPYAVLHKKLGVSGLIEMGIFVVILAYGLGYLWKRKALEWE